MGLLGCQFAVGSGSFGELAAQGAPIWDCSAASSQGTGLGACGRWRRVGVLTRRQPILAAVPLDSVVDVPGLCPPPEPYSYAVRAGDTLYLAGQVALDEAGEVVGTTVAEQARQVWDNIASVLAASGSSIADVVKITYFMQDVREIAEEIEVRREVFAGRPFPAVTACQAAALGLPGLKMEVDVIAVIGAGRE